MFFIGGTPPDWKLKILPLDDDGPELNRPPVFGWVVEVVDELNKPVDDLLVALLFVNNPFMLLLNKPVAFENSPLPLDAGVEFENRFENRLLAAGLVSSLFSPFYALFPFS